MAHVVVLLVFAQIGEVEAGAAEQRAVVALQQPVQTADHRPFEPAKDRLRGRCAHRDGFGLAILGAGVFVTGDSDLAYLKIHMLPLEVARFPHTPAGIAEKLHHVGRLLGIAFSLVGPHISQQRCELTAVGA